MNASCAATSILAALLLAPLGFAGSAVGRTLNESRAAHRGVGRHRQRRRLPGPRTAIVGGLPAPAGSFPWMALIVYNGSPSFACSGTVISPNVVLTAGHCVVDETTGVAYSPGGYEVITGSVDPADTAAGQVAAVSRTILDPEFNPSTVDGDAGLLVLATPTKAPAIRLATSSDVGLLDSGTGAVIAGWGETYPGSGQLATSLQWGATVVQSPTYCQQYAGSYDASKLCATDPPSFSTGTCFGDSGGPMIAFEAAADPVEIGITSTGPSDCATTSPDVFTRVDLLSSWAAGWVAAVAPASQPAAPAPPTGPRTAGRLPRMSRVDAASYTRQTLAGAFGGNFIHGRRYQAQCSRLAAARFRCTVGWSSGPDRYSGTVTVFYETGGAGVEWSSSYRVSAVNRNCYSGPGHPKICKAHVSHGSWPKARVTH